ncbi:hypothetical protein N7509_003370 [Penicillium cosmopolitanum]|uniref:Uncharacterized protein n=1 Tax=Penicillium cosmopolitanum TaxID=1131564 RepID=A0A9X0BBF4_9EURO|nr:uncharacterized protein N7509_003370 [Penicillium cosmopolitanum]KAJ5403499.1 hypothetical protein N7509_003370 [Penicillium cosmopolitanum]
MTDISKRPSRRAKNIATRRSHSTQFTPLLIGIFIIACLFVPFVLFPDGVLPWEKNPSARSQANKVNLSPANVSLSPRTDLQATKHNCSMPTSRYSLSTGITSCYPSSGGIWTAKLGPVELQHLQIDRFESSERHQDQAREDNFCYQLRLFGGSWYDLDEDDFWDNGKCVELYSGQFIPAVVIKREVGIQDDGIIAILDLNDHNLAPENRRALENALCMDHRAMVLGWSGAKACVNASSCPLLQDLSERPDMLQGISKQHPPEFFCGTFLFDSVA